ncbi:hypothetical protein FSP39_009154 [Pinctada imbricata]|uniref:Sphingomyelin synthase-like domain-containing protein n=1 Tax=Pinctada imbricata TaxID=66713 RepID=A0AA89BZ29_PINIB|nr:hypothetical protein FSP39_009154 [Pinctada imbricata]
MFLSHIFVCYIIVVVNDRLPDRTKYPPLPDMVLDNIKYLPWGSKVAEICLLTLSITWLLLMVFHKSRLVAMRRILILLGTMYLVRSVCIYVTSIPVPDTHKACDVYPNSTFLNKTHRAYLIWSRLGMTVMGNRTCGDYIFSGHTVMLTMVNLFLIEYTPKSWKVLRFCSWSLNICGMYFILACRGHYTIDVLIAFLISMQLFKNYHALVDVRPLTLKEKRSSFLCYALLYIFESEVPQPVENVFEWPMQRTVVSEKLSIMA